MAIEVDPIPVESSELIGPSILVFMGPEGVGKSTQAKLYARRYDYVYIGTGDMVREKAASGEISELGEACVRAVTSNLYLEPQSLSQLLKERLQADDVREKRKVVIDGAMRTLKETQDFDLTLLLSGIRSPQVTVVGLDIPIPVGYKRARKRGSLRDSREAVRSRLGEYCRDLPQRLEIIKSRYNYYEIDASESPWYVASRVRGTLKREEIIN